MATINDLPQKGGLKATLLWNNPSPQNEFAGQTITLSGSLADYKYIRIGYKHSDNSVDTEENIYYIDVDLSNKHRYIASETMRYGIVEYSATSYLTGYAVRYMYYPDTTYSSLTISNCNRVGGTGSYNKRIIPRRIYGLK